MATKQRAINTIRWTICTGKLAG